jgi:hypothetical protein
MKAVLCLLACLSTSCMRLDTWSGDVYSCDRELLERVAAEKGSYLSSQQQKGESTCQTIQSKKEQAQ